MAKRKKKKVSKTKAVRAKKVDGRRKKKARRGRSSEASGAKKKDGLRYLVIEKANGMRLSITAELTVGLRHAAKIGEALVIDRQRLLAMTPKGAWSSIGELDIYSLDAGQPEIVVDADEESEEVSAEAPSAPESEVTTAPELQLDQSRPTSEAERGVPPAELRGQDDDEEDEHKPAPSPHGDEAHEVAQAASAAG